MLLKIGDGSPVTAPRYGSHGGLVRIAARPAHAR